MERILLILLLWTYFSQTKAQDTWQHIEGLPCEETSSVAQDTEGYIWIGTRLGLVRYDGYSKNFYRNDMNRPHAFSSSDIKCLAVGPDGRIFAGSFFGLNTFDKRTQTVEITHFEGNDFVRAVHFDKQGRLWIGTDNGLYLQAVSEEEILFRQVPRGRILEIEETYEGEVIIVTQENGIFIINKEGNCSQLKDSEQLSPTTALCDADGSIWIGTNRKGLYQIDEGKFVCHEGYEGLYMNDLLSVPSGQGHIYMATDAGIATYPFGTKDLSLEGKNVQSLCQDREGNIWATAESQGLYFKQHHKMPFAIVKHPFTRQTTPIISQFDVSHLADTAIWKSLSHINAVYEKSDGTAYIGTWNNGMYITKDNTVRRHITKKNSAWLLDNSIYNINSLSHDTLLIGTWYGLYLMDTDGKGVFIDHIGTSNISKMHTLSATVLSHDDIWLGLVGGIAHIKGGLQKCKDAKIVIYTHVNKKGIVSPKDVGLLTDKHDDEGEYQLGGIYRIVKDANGRIWACTSEPGLLLYDEQNDCFRCVSQRMGILGDNVHSLDIDRYGNFWMTTNYGILQMSVNDKGEVIKQQLYALNDGLPTSYYGSTMSTLLADGRLCFLNQDHLVTILPTGEPGMSLTERAYISDILVNNTPITNTRLLYDFLPPYTNRITLPHNQNNITFRLTALAFGHEPSTRFSYRLEGVDNEYLRTDMGVNYVRYNQLPPGTYKLHYHVYNESNDTRTENQILIIKVKEPIWWCWWSKLLYLSVLLLISYIIIHNVIDRNRKQQQLKLLEVERVKQEEYYKKRMNFYTKALHEFLTPLTLMSEMVHDLHKKVRPALQATLFMLSNQTDRLVETLGNMVDAKDSEAQDVLAKAKELTQVDRDFLRKCTDSVNNHISDVSYSHQVMMREVGASHATLYRKLKQLTGMDATSFIRSIRMKAACQILTHEPNIRINELSERVGYNNPGYFSTCFKNEFGMTPKEFQQRENE